MKFVLSFLIILSSLVFFESQAFPFRLRGCALVNSNQCKDPNRFKVHLRKGCGSASSNCRLKFCKANCLDLEASDEDSLPHNLLHLCKKNCLDNALLVRLDSSSRAALYANFLPSQNRGGKRARKYAKFAFEKEGTVLKTKSRQWWRLGRKPKNLALYNKLEAEYRKLIEKKVRKLEAAKARGDKRSTAKLTRDVTHLVAEAAETLVPVPVGSMKPFASAPDEESMSNQTSLPRRPSELSPRERYLAKKAYSQWLKTVQGKKEAAQVSQDRAALVQSLVSSTGAPSEIAAEAIDMAGEWRTGDNGERYFVPTPPPPPPLPGNDLLKKSSRRVSPPASRASSGASEDSQNEEGTSAAPPPPLPFAGKSSPDGRTALLSDLQSENPLSRLKKRSPSVDSARSSPPQNDPRGELLAAIQKGKALKPVKTDDRSGAFANKEKDSSPRTGIAAGIDAILARRGAIAGKDDDDASDAGDDDDWEE